MIPLKYKYYNKGILLATKGNCKKAIEYFDKAIELDKNNAKFYYDKGLCLYISNNEKDALDLYDKAIEIDPELARAYINKAVILYKNTRYKDALQVIEKAIEIDSNIPEAYYNEGVILGKLCKNKDALDCLDKAISLNPKYINAYYEKGLMLGHMNMNDQAIEYFDKVLELDNKHVGAHYDKGIALINKKEYEKAIELFLLLLSLDPINEKECIDNINKCLLYEIKSKYFRFEKEILDRKEIKPNDNQLLPQGYNHTIKQGLDTFAFYKLNMAIYCKAYYDDPSIFNELFEMISLMKENTPNEYNDLVDFINSTDIFKKFTRRWKNCYEIIQEMNLDNDGVSHSKLASYQSKYEIEEILVILAIIRKLITKKLLDLELSDKKDANGKYKKGVLADYIFGGLNNFPIFKKEFIKAYSSKLRNIIGHNNYEIREDKIIDLDRKFSMTAEEFSESYKSMSRLQNTVLWFIQMITISDKIPNIIDSGIIAISFEINAKRKTIDFFVLQLWCFYEYDKNMDWLSVINISLKNNNIIFSFSENTLFDEPINNTLSNNPYKELLELFKTDKIKDYKVANIRLMPIAPLIDIQSDGIIIKNERFQFLNKSYEKEIPINYK